MILGNIDNAIGDPLCQHFHEFGKTIKAIVLLTDFIQLYARCTIYHMLECMHITTKDCRYFVADAQVKEIRRLTEEQWQYVLDVAVDLADGVVGEFLFGVVVVILGEIGDRPLG